MPVTQRSLVILQNPVTKNLSKNNSADHQQYKGTEFDNQSLQDTNLPENYSKAVTGQNKGSKASGETEVKAVEDESSRSEETQEKKHLDKDETQAKVLEETTLDSGYPESDKKRSRSSTNSTDVHSVKFDDKSVTKEKEFFLSTIPIPQGDSGLSNALETHSSAAHDSPLDYVRCSDHLHDTSLEIPNAEPNTTLKQDLTFESTWQGSCDSTCNQEVTPIPIPRPAVDDLSETADNSGSGSEGQPECKPENGTEFPGYTCLSDPQCMSPVVPSTLLNNGKTSGYTSKDPICLTIQPLSTRLQQVTVNTVHMALPSIASNVTPVSPQPNTGYITPDFASRLDNTQSQNENDSDLSAANSQVVTLEPRTEAVSGYVGEGDLGKICGVGNTQNFNESRFSVDFSANDESHSRSRQPSGTDSGHSSLEQDCVEDDDQSSNGSILSEEAATHSPIDKNGYIHANRMSVLHAQLNVVT